MVERIRNTINIGYVMRNHTKFNISPKAVLEMINFIEAHLDPAMVKLEEIAKKNKRKTIFPEDVIQLFSYKENGVIDYEN